MLLAWLKLCQFPVTLICKFFCCYVVHLLFFFIFRGVKISSNPSNIWPTKANHPCAGSQSSLNQFHQFDFVVLALKIIRCGLSHGPCGFHVVVLDRGQPTKTCVFGFVPCFLLPFWPWQLCFCLMAQCQAGLLRCLGQFHQNDHQISHWPSTFSDHSRGSYFICSVCLHAVLEF